MDIQELISELTDSRSITIGPAYRRGAKQAKNPAPVTVIARVRGSKPKKVSVRIFHVVKGKLVNVEKQFGFHSVDVTEAQAGKAFDSAILHVIDGSNKFVTPEKLATEIAAMELACQADFFGRTMNAARALDILRLVTMAAPLVEKSSRESMQHHVVLMGANHTPPVQKAEVLAVLKGAVGEILQLK